MTPADGLDPVWRALASPVRRRILDALRDGPRTTGELVECFPELSRFAVMQHMDVLEEANLIIARPQGRLRYNLLNPVPIRQVYERWVKQYEGLWAGMLTGLKDRAEGDSRPRGVSLRTKRTGSKRGGSSSDQSKAPASGSGSDTGRRFFNRLREPNDA